MVESSLKEVDSGVIEASHSMGSSPFQIIYKVLIPEAKPSLLVGCHSNYNDPQLFCHGRIRWRRRAGCNSH
jgi:ABC-type nitrate/sulfonate/bicarbonate transport system permease component